MMKDMNTELIMPNEHDATIRDLQSSNMRLQERIQYLEDRITHHMNEKDELRSEMYDWRNLASGLYNYYHLGEGISKVVRDYERKINGE
jgi:hypothetical protein